MLHPKAALTAVAQQNKDAIAGQNMERLTSSLIYLRRSSELLRAKDLKALRDRWHGIQTAAEERWRVAQEVKAAARAIAARAASDGAARADRGSDAPRGAAGAAAAGRQGSGSDRSTSRRSDGKQVGKIADHDDRGREVQ